VLDACTTPGVVERPVVPGVGYVGFIDAAAGSGRDSFAAAIAHADLQPDGQVVAVLDAVREVKPPFDPVAVTGELATFLQTYGIDVVQAEKFAGRWVVETFARHGITVVQDAEPKSAVYIACLPLLTGQRCDLLDLPGLRGQLTALERRRRAGGRDVVDHLPGAHDDLANAATGRWCWRRSAGRATWACWSANASPQPSSPP
jgi:hypothetical protein